MQTDTNPRVERALRAIDGLKLGDVRAFARQLAASFPMVAYEVTETYDATRSICCQREIHAEQSAKPENAS